MTLGDALRRRREALGLSQKALADRLGVEQATVSRWEKGTQSPRSEQFDALAEFLAVTVRELVGLIYGHSPDEPGRHSPAAASGVAIPDDLNEEERALLDATLDVIRKRRAMGR